MANGQQLAGVEEPEGGPGGAPERAPGRSLRERARLGTEAVVLALIVAFAVLNVGDVTVNWIFGSARVPLIVAIVVSLIAGMFIAHVSHRRAGKRR